MLNLKQRLADIKAYVNALEEWIILSLKDFSINGVRLKNKPGVWIKSKDKGYNKIADLGVRISSWVTWHGIAMTVNPDLFFYNDIVTCVFSDAEIKNYINSHTADYQRKASRNIQYVSFEENPTEDDLFSIRLRLDALKEVAKEFINDRTNDRIGLVVYAGESYTKTPVTSDKSIIIKSLEEINFDGVIEDGTAIGMGLATAVNRLKDSKAKSKVVILLTDGVNNSGFIDPNTAADLASSYEIKTYTIGLGTNGNALAPIAINPNGSFTVVYTHLILPTLFRV